MLKFMYKYTFGNSPSWYLPLLATLNTPDQDERFSLKWSNRKSYKLFRTAQESL